VSLCLNPDLTLRFARLRLSCAIADKTRASKLWPLLRCHEIAFDQQYV
jgi:hypothetical protein